MLFDFYCVVFGKTSRFLKYLIAYYKKLLRRLGVTTVLRSVLFAVYDRKEKRESMATEAHLIIGPKRI